MKSFEDRCLEVSISLSRDQLKKFARYKALIQNWNQVIDITAITDDQEIDNKHFLDSLSIFRIIKEPKHKKVLDMGTGGGFPAIPMKIYEPTLSITLLDSLKKRIDFLKLVGEDLELDKLDYIHGRAEDVFHDKKYRESYDYVVSRAVAPLPTLLEYCLPGVRLGGYFIAMKGPNIDEELALSKKALKLLGGKLLKVDSFLWTEERYERNLLLFQKVMKTPKSFPRGQAKPRKDPIVSCETKE